MLTKPMGQNELAEAPRPAQTIDAALNRLIHLEKDLSAACECLEDKVSYLLGYEKPSTEFGIAQDTQKGAISELHIGIEAVEAQALRLYHLLEKLGEA